MAALRTTGLLVAGAMRADHPFIAWATAVSQATLAAFVTLAILAPSGIVAAIPLPARLAGLAASLAAYGVLRGRLLPAMLVGLLVLVAMRWLLSPP